MLLKLLLKLMIIYGNVYGRKSKRYIFYNNNVFRCFCKHKDLPFSLTECLLKKVFSKYQLSIGECLLSNLILSRIWTKKQYPTQV